MQIIKSRSRLLPVIAALGLASGAALAQAQSPAPADKAKAQKPAKSADLPAGRDWSKIDTNRDHLISPEEMEAFLKANPGPLASK